MTIKDGTRHYGWISIAIHWIAAVGIIGLFGLGLWMTGLPYTHPWYTRAPEIHQSLGVLLLGLVLLRVLWRGGNGVPDLEPHMAAWERHAARAAHALLYLLMLTVLFSGYLIPTADGSWVSVFGWFSAPPVDTGIERQEDLAGTIHYWSAWLLIGLAGLHTLAALKHHFIERDRTLKKILKPIHE